MRLFALSINDTPIPLPGQIDTINNQSGKYGIHIFQLAVNLLLLAAVIVTLVFIIFGGFKWMISQGDKKKIDEAKQTLIWAIIGLIVVMMAFFAVTILGAFFNVPILLFQ